jgi:hypothetical protein
MACLPKRAKAFSGLTMACQSLLWPDYGMLAKARQSLLWPNYGMPKPSLA